MEKPAKREWVVISEGAFLKNLRAALRGDGIAGGAFTLDRARATKYTHVRAQRAARAVYRGSCQRADG